ncbi:MAG: hypothetical protein ACI9BD_000981 [Candidatus Marinamargulisbacteria bacterium]|jgi:hypothetical protein
MTIEGPFDSDENEPIDPRQTGESAQDASETDNDAPEPPDNKGIPEKPEINHIDETESSGDIRHIDATIQTPPDTETLSHEKHRDEATDATAETQHVDASLFEAPKIESITPDDGNKHIHVEATVNWEAINRERDELIHHSTFTRAVPHIDPQGVILSTIPPETPHLGVTLTGVPKIPKHGVFLKDIPRSFLPTRPLL